MSLSTGQNKYSSSLGQSISRTPALGAPRIRSNPYQRTGLALKMNASAAASIAMPVPAPGADKIPFSLENDYDLSKYSQRFL